MGDRRRGDFEGIWWGVGDQNQVEILGRLVKLTIFAKIECIPSEDFQVKSMGVGLWGFNSTSNCDCLSCNNGRTKRSNFLII